jgi:predicted Zn finger-like uncharacterized protein
MIVCCPSCQTRFNVDPALLGPDGRKVRCARCAHVWRVGQDGLPVSTGQFGLRAPQMTAPASGAAAQGDAPAAADIPPAPAAQEEAEGSGAPASSTATEDTSLWARELIEREKEASQAAGAADAAASEAEETQHGEAAGAANMELSAGAATATGTGSEAMPEAQAGQRARADAAAKQAARKPRSKKGGQTFKMFLLVLCLVVLALFAIAALTGKFGPGGIAPDSQAPTTGDVTPPETGAGTADPKPNQADGGGAQ